MFVREKQTASVLKLIFLLTHRTTSTHSFWILLLFKNVTISPPLLLKDMTHTWEDCWRILSLKLLTSSLFWNNRGFCFSKEDSFQSNIIAVCSCRWEQERKLSVSDTLSVRVCCWAATLFWCKKWPNLYPTHFVSLCLLLVCTHLSLFVSLLNVIF